MADKVASDMATVFRQRHADGTTTYSDRPLPADEPTAADLRRERVQDATAAIKEAQKRIPKLADYFEYFQYLRDRGRFWRLERALQELKLQDPAVWLKLQSHPQFRPLLTRAFGLQVADKHLAAGVGLALGKYSGSLEKWLETTVQDMMKADRWGRYADVLGSKATTLAAPPARTYSNSRLGQHLQAEDARLAQASKASVKGLETARAAVRSHLATAITRPGNVLLDLGLGALNPDVHMGVGNVLVRTRLDRAWAAGALDDAQYETARSLLAQGKLAELQAFMQGVRGGR